MFRSLSIERVGAKAGVKIGSLESLSGKEEIKAHRNLRNFSFNVDLPTLNYFFHIRMENPGLVRGLIMN